jgi:hypothetical protein
MASIIKSDNGVSSGITGIVQSADSSGQLVLQTTTSGGTATTAVTIDNTQKVTFANSIGFGSNAGITFNNSSATVNSTLNDYEVGTYTPTDQSGAGLSLTINQTATYTKIGKIVNVTFNITYPTTSSTLGASISLPFTASSNSHFAGAIGPNSTSGTVLPLVISANAYVQFGANNGFFIANSGFSGKQIIMTATYLVNF